MRDPERVIKKSNLLAHHLLAKGTLRRVRTVTRSRQSSVLSLEAGKETLACLNQVFNAPQ
jgi:hypothetical protein